MSRAHQAALAILGGWLFVVGLAHAAGWFFLAGFILGGGIGFSLGALFFLLVQESMSDHETGQSSPSRAWRRHVGL